jgi:hypothetical protein
MAVPHYAYLKLKMPCNNRTTITIHGKFSRSNNCDREFQKIASKFGVKKEIKTLDILPKKLPLVDRASKPEEIDSGKKSKKQAVNPATFVEAVNASAEAINASTEVVDASTEATAVRKKLSVHQRKSVTPKKTLRLLKKTSGATYVHL